MQFRFLHILLFCFYFFYTLALVAKDSTKFRINAIEAISGKGIVRENFYHFPPHGSAYIASISLIEVLPAYFSKRVIPFNFTSKGSVFNVVTYGNNYELGFSLNAVRFAELKLLNTRFFDLQFRIAGGLGFVNRTWDAEKRPNNVGMSLPINFSGQVYLFSNFKIHPKWFLYAGGGFFHVSNGHVHLPNFGLNVLSTTVGLRFNYRQAPEFVPQSKFKPYNLLGGSFGIGLQEYGDARIAFVPGSKPVYQANIFAGRRLTEYVQLNIGLAAKTFTHYYEQSIAEGVEPYASSPFKSASGVFAFISSNFIFGNAGAHFSLGYNLIKTPFYDYFFDNYVRKKDPYKFLDSNFSNRYGFFYSTKKLFKLNNAEMKIGLYINGNYFDADFTEICVSYAGIFGRKN